VAMPLLQTKLYRPTRLGRPAQARAVHRPRLLEKLNAGLRSKLILVSAPAGFGKSTVLSEWIDDLRPVWLGWHGACSLLDSMTFKWLVY